MTVAQGATTLMKEDSNKLNYIIGEATINNI
jgi:hypothetical protein